MDKVEAAVIIAAMLVPVVGALALFARSQGSRHTTRPFDPRRDTTFGERVALSIADDFPNWSKSQLADLARSIDENPMQGATISHGISAGGARTVRVPPSVPGE